MRVRHGSGEARAHRRLGLLHGERDRYGHAARRGRHKSHAGRLEGWLQAHALHIPELPRLFAVLVAFLSFAQPAEVGISEKCAENEKDDCFSFCLFVLFPRRGPWVGERRRRGKRKCVVSVAVPNE